ncbi:tRNA (adenosine(37)-N6)-dimethylallyltransferase MiaA [Sphingomonas sp. AAP5]|uniref:tRNA (adenosine(37)-N6)-dimethylallyltransferase MiaA n=1 Tax=Sphingomonas sp. AAP5 TaxID=1523415 RepID=UPI00105756F3|nr:tRNA (adenosine(37)-N6)-dimethylallyltransferase MiaA [Sphingomonas sp. AAP5]QBM75675.1 tRNA (adenosine(37)-N6)-dimethylallyltransferase MiaA [Sphingomonas sp. AAP5]
MNTVNLPQVALIAGPTASGKSALGIAVAERHDGIVINADSAQVYRDLRVLTARPTEADEARVPHRLFGQVDGAESYSAARWADEARAEIDRAHALGKLPVLVGGTGLYLRTLLDGIAPVPEIDPAIRAEVRALPVAQAHAALAALDPPAAARLAPADTTRVARALEVVRSTGRTLTRWQEERSGGIGERIALAAIVLLPDRDWLWARCDSRAATMLAGGARAEVSALLARSEIAPEAPIRRAIGVREVASTLSGEISQKQAVDAVALATRQYAKRQYTWFRNQPPASWHRTAALESDERSGSFDILLRI